MKSRAQDARSAMHKFLVACIAGALVFVWMGLALAWGAALVRWGRMAGKTWTGWESAGIAVALVWTGLCVVVLGYAGRHWSDRVFIGVSSGMALVVGLGWAWATRGMEKWPMDSGLFHWFLERLADGGFSVENLRTLVDVYDYPVWTRRALPFCLPLRLLVGPNHFVWAIQLVQAVIGSVGVALAWRVAKLLFGGRVARWAATVLVAMPGYALQVVGLNHQVWGAFWFLAGWWLLTEWSYGEEGATCKTGLVFVACVLVPVVRLAGFAGTMYLLCAACVLVFGIVQGSVAKSKALGALVWLLAVPLAVSWTALRPLSKRMDEANPVPIRGGQLAFAARGWDCRGWGEYVEEGERLDILTPPMLKNRLFQMYIAGQCAYNGWHLTTKLFPAKVTKFMLAGYASLAEEVLWANGAERTGRVARGMRTGWFVLIYAPLMLWGLWRLSRRVGAGDGRVAWMVLPVAIFGVAVMVAGETSPRYAMPVQALLVAAGACGWARERKEEEKEGGFVLKHPFAMGTVLVMVGYGAFAGGILGGREVWKRYALADMREAVLEGGHPSEEAFQGPFEAVFPGGEGSVIWRGRGGNVAVYLRGRSWREKGRAEISSGEGEWQEVELPVRVEIAWKKDAERRLAVRRTGEEGEVWMGYADVCEGVEP